MPCDAAAIGLPGPSGPSPRPSGSVQNSYMKYIYALCALDPYIYIHACLCGCAAPLHPPLTCQRCSRAPVAQVQQLSHGGGWGLQGGEGQPVHAIRF